MNELQMRVYNWWKRRKIQQQQQKKKKPKIPINDNKTKERREKLYREKPRSPALKRKQKNNKWLKPDWLKLKTNIQKAKSNKNMLW